MDVPKRRNDVSIGVVGPEDKIILRRVAGRTASAGIPRSDHTVDEDTLDEELEEGLHHGLEDVHLLPAPPVGAPPVPLEDPQPDEEGPEGRVLRVDPQQAEEHRDHSHTSPASSLYRE